MLIKVVLKYRITVKKILLTHSLQPEYPMFVSKSSGGLPVSLQHHSLRLPYEPTVLRGQQFFLRHLSTSVSVRSSLDWCSPKDFQDYELFQSLSVQLCGLPRCSSATPSLWCAFLHQAQTAFAWEEQLHAPLFLSRFPSRQDAVLLSGCRDGIPRAVAPLSQDGL